MFDMFEHENCVIDFRLNSICSEIFGRRYGNSSQFSYISTFTQWGRYLPFLKTLIYCPQKKLNWRIFHIKRKFLKRAVNYYTTWYTTICNNKTIIPSVLACNIMIMLDDDGRRNECDDSQCVYHTQQQRQQFDWNCKQTVPSSVLIWQTWKMSLGNYHLPTNEKQTIRIE